MRSRTWMNPIGWTVLLLPLAGSGCAELAEAVKEKPLLPAAGLNRVDLVQSPDLNTMLGWSCFEYINDDFVCGLAGFSSQPKRDRMKFSFDTVFDLYNPNGGFAIPLIEMLLGITVFEDDNLGSLCVSFCDPEEESCEPTRNAEDACRIDEKGETVKGPEDLVPTVDELIDLATDVASGDLSDLFTWKVIPKYEERECATGADACEEQEIDGVTNLCCGGECAPLEPGCSVGKGENGKTCALCDGHVEAHIQFDFDIDTMLGLFERLLTNAINGFITGDAINLNVPFSAEGTLFFDVPTLGRQHLGFGPFEDVWPIL